MFGQSKITLNIFLAIFFAGQLYAQQYLWPLQIEPQLSAKFGDYRAGHWHAGIDIRTQGRTGFKILAPADGFAFKVRTSFWGYGKSLYLKLADGNMTVYGHLQGFTPALDEVVRNKQLQQKNYLQDIMFEPGQYPVKKGDLIAFSGQTGVGYPHLHFEIRDKNNIPLNPLKYAYQLPDKLPPIIQRVAIKRYREYGLYNYHDLEFLEIKGNGSNYSVHDTIALYDKMVIAISAYDPGIDFSYGIYRVRLLIDDTEIFALARDSLNYMTGSQISYVNDNELSELINTPGDSDKDIFYRLYIQQGDIQTFYGSYRYPAGIVDAVKISSGTHSVCAIVYDANGNDCQVQFYIKKASLPNPTYNEMTIGTNKVFMDIEKLEGGVRFHVQARRTVGSPYIDLYCQYDSRQNRLNFAKVPSYNNYRIRMSAVDGSFSPWIEFNVQTQKSKVIAYADLLKIIYSLDEHITINGVLMRPVAANIFPCGGNAWRAFMEMPVKNGYVSVESNKNSSLFNAYRYDSGGLAFSPDSTIVLTFADNNLYCPILVGISNFQRNKEGNYSFEITPHELLFSGQAQLAYTINKNTIDSLHTSLYLNSESGRAWFNRGQVSGTRFKGTITTGGIYAQIADTRPPSINGLKPANGSSLRNLKPIVSCSISDNLSGFGKESQFEMTIDDNWVPAEYDVTTGIFSYQINQSLKPGPHQAKIKATDSQGNIATAISKFTVLGKY